MEKEITGVLEAPHTIAQIVKGTTAEFSRYKEGQLFYSVDVEGYRYEFPITTIEDVVLTVEKEVATISGPIKLSAEVDSIKLSGDIGETTFEKTYKAITLMRYIRKAIADKTLRWDKLVA